MFFLIFGISGVLVIAMNFIFEVSNKWDKKHINFAWFNLYGSFALFSYSLYYKVWLFVLLNGFLTIIGIYGLFGVYRRIKKMF
ncbi:MAG: hypothetical protein KC550_03560 [Nanoarchaeota archaeon]|nr:hypothetical protein [Nanoarchaeota archaeon]